jgi:transposase
LRAAGGGDDLAASWRAGVAGDRPHRHAQGFDGLALLVQETLKRNPHAGHLFVFRGRRGSLIKVLWHDGQGMCLFAKRLERGRFVWPSTAPRDGDERTVTITPAQLGYLLEGIDWRLPQHTWRPQAAG